ncbi:MULTISPECIES: hypothetical protein [unclassified Streptomyces]|uniref:hypothetical protein n=2 Tax=Streptomyces TaxID=1883 RepID=UPI002DDC0A43|nr:hypothetical protein [Streptomyces sp. NBC_01257]WRZ65160.1 hypothetical protein OG408_15250 [Streptomyces sp. NBC_01257]
MSDWGSFMDESSSAPPPPRAQPAAPAAAEADGWGSFADEAPAADAAASPPPPPPGPPQGFVRGHGVPVPSPEVAASLLSAGETLWAQVDGAQAVLGSGCRVGVVPDEDGNAVADGFSGWRPVTVVDPAALTVRLVPLALSEPPVGVATPVAELYADPEPYTAPAPGRAGPFPTGQGPDLDELLNRVLSEERARARADAEAEARRAEQELARLKGELKDQAQAAESRAEQREQRAQEAARRAQEYAEQQIAAARDDAARIVWQLQDRAQRAEAEIARLTGELARAEQAGVLRHVLDRRRRAGGGRDQGA